MIFEQADLRYLGIKKSVSFNILNGLFSIFTRRKDVTELTGEAPHLLMLFVPKNKRNKRNLLEFDHLRQALCHSEHLD